MARRVRSIGARPGSLFTTMACGVAVREQELTLENKIVMLNRSQAEALPAWSSAFTYLRKELSLTSTPHTCGRAVLRQNPCRPELRRHDR
jgi:hypothetical protein